MNESELSMRIGEYIEDNSYVLAYFTDQVCLGVYREEMLIFAGNPDMDLLTEIRVFNPNQELHLLFSNGMIRAIKLTDDTNSTSLGVVEDPDQLDWTKLAEAKGRISFDELYFVSGTSMDSSAPNTTYQQGRIVTLPNLPFEWDTSSKPLRLRVRNYIDFIPVTEGIRESVITENRLVGFETEGD